eukprot:c38668_g1_i1 orf=141-530(+)
MLSRLQTYVLASCSFCSSKSSNPFVTNANGAKVRVGKLGEGVEGEGELVGLAGGAHVHDLDSDGASATVGGHYLASCTWRHYTVGYAALAYTRNLVLLAARSSSLEHGPASCCKQPVSGQLALLLPIAR